jgi:hypothetical protein
MWPMSIVTGVGQPTQTMVPPGHASSGACANFALENFPPDQYSGVRPPLNSTDVSQVIHKQRGDVAVEIIEAEVAMRASVVS